jgi:chloramphenicol 3-O-phosphotransferase
MPLVILNGASEVAKTTIARALDERRADEDGA